MTKSRSVIDVVLVMLGVIILLMMTFELWLPHHPAGLEWLDSTHITFGVLTAGVDGPKWKAEASAFNGREPDDRRADFDLGPLDSVAGRLSLAPTEHLALQISARHLHDAEAVVGQQPRADVNRITAFGDLPSALARQQSEGDYGRLWCQLGAEHHPGRSNRSDHARRAHGDEHGG
jgi:hypothetical protein